jgi:hypothetical protein
MNSVVMGIIIHGKEYLGLACLKSISESMMCCPDLFHLSELQSLVSSIVHGEVVVRYMLSLKAPFSFVHNTVFIWVVHPGDVAGDIKGLTTFLAVLPLIVHMAMTHALFLSMRDLARTLREKTVVVSFFTAHTILGIWCGHDGFWKECGQGT